MTIGTLLPTLAGSAAAGLLGAEMLTRQFLRRTGYYVWPRFYRRRIHLDRQIFPQMERASMCETNADGERGGAIPDGPGLFRMLLLGGSTVESAFNDQATCWAGQLQAMLSTAESKELLGADHVHVGNVGRSGMDVPAVELVLERTMCRYSKLDAIAMMVGPGDLMRWLEAGAPPQAVNEPLTVERCFQEHPEGRFTFAPRGLAMVEVLRRLRLRYLRPVEVRENAGRWMARARTLRANAKRNIDEIPDTTRFLAKFEADLEATVARARRKTRRVFLIRQPAFRKSSFTPEEDALLWNGGIGNAYSGAQVTDFYTTRVIYAVLDQLEAIIERVARRHGATFIDTLPAMTMSAATFYDHMHLTPQGSRELAGSVAAAVLEAVREH